MTDIIDLLKKHNNLSKEKDRLGIVVKNLEKNEIVKEYIEYKTKYDLISNEELEAYKEYKMAEYEECDHLFIMKKARSISDCICIKCGLKEDAINKDFAKKDNLSLDEKIMVEYLKHKSYLMFINGTYSNIVCNYDEAKKAYDEIVYNNPFIENSDEITSLIKKKLNLK